MILITHPFSSGRSECKQAEVESSRTSLASRTHFEVLGLGLEASSPQKLPCPRLENSTFFANCWNFVDRLKKNFGRRFLLENAWKFFWRPFFWRALAPVSLVHGLGLEHSCPWPRECLSSEGLFLALAADFFCVFGLEPCVLDSTSASKQGRIKTAGGLRHKLLVGTQNDVS